MINFYKTILRYLYDSHKRKVQTWMGTNDSGATADDPSDGGTAPNNMVQVSQAIYDDGDDGGDGNITQTRQYDAGSSYYATKRKKGSGVF